MSSILPDMEPSWSPPEGSRWLHVWVERMPPHSYILLAIQVETVGVRLTAAPYVLVTPTEGQHILTAFELMPRAVRHEAGVSVPLDSEGE